MKRFKIGDRVVVLDNFNTTAKGKVGTIITNRDRGHVVGFFCDGVRTNHSLHEYKHLYRGLKATWSIPYHYLTTAIISKNKFR